jgi:uncharacterized protein (TIGR00369 family)
MSPPADPSQDGWTPRTLPGFAGLIGPLWTRREEQGWAYAVLIEERHANPAGVAHGGLISTLADHALSVIAWEANARRPCITVALDVRFLAPARPGDLVVARGRVVRQTGSLAFVEGRVAVGDLEIATASAILSVRNG